MPRHRPAIIYGVFKGMGDLLWATPVIRAELERGAAVHLILFSSSALADFVELVDYGPCCNSLHLHYVSKDVRSVLNFLRELWAAEPEWILISPHAPLVDSSWKVPLALRVLQLLFWPNSRLIGADTERFSNLFDQKLPIDRTLPLNEREWSAYRLLQYALEAGGDAILPTSPPLVHFLPEIHASRALSAAYDLVIHPGASAENRRWPATKYASLLAALPLSWNIAILGLPKDIAELRLAVAVERPIDYVSGTLRRSIETLASASRLLVMDSGNMHFAQVLGVPTVAIFGQQNPAGVIGSGLIDAVYEQSVSCQPCGRSVCSQPEVYCLINVEPLAVARRLIMLKPRMQEARINNHG